MDTIVATEADTKRAQYIRDLRAAADWLEANPDIPVGAEPLTAIEYCVRTSENITDALTEVDRVAALLGPDCVVRDRVGSRTGLRHYNVEKQLSSTIQYRAFSVSPVVPA